eukprot:gnl/MRDRNA2_/MRDRNA2_34301_c0_seq1.p1 gnl/MRDRNA2_/MRDRNA2_34301_c0~~gnl/MRDRNA2_/MRDRNA2_34301_c0_seq1.p1  ORF type:complete len:279 (-),score=53.36 gnl/MRDRNA2_/MRDRNA2_34301_c0_seq1:232-996(-)
MACSHLLRPHHFLVPCLIALKASAAPSPPLHAGHPEYWDSYYKKSTREYDWFRRYDQGGKETGKSLKDVMRKHIQTTDRILNVGAGMSLLSEDMWKDGFKSIENIDISETAMDAMRKRDGGKTNMTYRVLDTRNMVEIADGTYDIVLDKGLLDVLAGSPDEMNIPKTLSEIHRVITATGKYVFVSFAGDDRRTKFVAPYAWGCSQEAIEKPYKSQYTTSNEDFVYVCDKTKPRDEAAAAAAAEAAAEAANKEDL